MNNHRFDGNYQIEEYSNMFKLKDVYGNILE